MFVRLLDIDKGSFRPQENELLGPDIAFVVNLLRKKYFFTYMKAFD